MSDSNDSQSTNLSAVELHINKLNLQPGDVLMVKVKGDDIDGVSSLDSLAENLRALFPNNKVALFYVDKDSEIEFNVVEQSEGDQNEPNS